MIKVPFDYKNACPDCIVNQLTFGWATFHNDSAVGYIDDAPVVFRWCGNRMEILFTSEKELERCKPRLEEYIEDNGISVEGKISEWRKAKRAKK